MTRVQLSTRWAVNAETSVTLRANQQAAWAVMQQFSRFVAADPYHTRLTDGKGRTLDTIPPRGSTLRIGHGIGFTWFYRAGTLIRVMPGRGFGFTDLSERGRTVGFPHLYMYTLDAIDSDTCKLTLRVRGRWSAQWMPRWLVRGWLWWVMQQAHWRLHAHLTYQTRHNPAPPKQNQPRATS